MKSYIWIRRIGLGVGLAGMMLAALLWLCATASTQATGQPPAVTRTTSYAQSAPAWGSTEPVWGSTEPVWGSTEPVTILFTSTETIRWNIAPYSAVITLPKDLLSASGSYRPHAIITFTPTSGYTFTAPLTALDQFFALDGKFVLDGMAASQPQIEAQAVAFNPEALPNIEWYYQDAELLGVQETSLQLYVYWKLFGLEGWDAQPGSIYPDGNQAVFEMSRVGTYGFGGYRGRLYLPIILKIK
ncbi:MAG: hypothetical protein JW934_20480 [Anaerolineae bacterium]|nr:hypothetical protein [Anaerolineae bacterium]